MTLAHSGSLIDTIEPLPLAAIPVVENTSADIDTSGGDPTDDSTNHDGATIAVVKKLDIEHAVVENDPRAWSSTKKTAILIMISLGAVTPTLGAAIYNPAFSQLEQELHATESQLALSLSIFVLLQGVIPMFWTALAEATGRKWVYLTSYTVFIIGTLVASRSNSMGLLIGMRCLQAIGSAAVLSIGAGTLADIYETKERGTKMGLYYAAPLLGPSMGPLVGGALTSGFNWRATFYFICSLGAVSWVAFWFFPDTWRKERSAVYQSAYRDFLKQKLENEGRLETSEKQQVPSMPIQKRNWRGKLEYRSKSDFRIQFKHITPVPAAIRVLKKPHNVIVMIASGFLFAAQYTVAFTSALTFSAAPYNYSAFKVGLVLVSFGGGNIIGSILGGRYSDRVLKHLKAKNGGVGEPEMRCRSMIPPMPLIVLGFLGYAWCVQEKTSIAGPVVFLFVAGSSLMVTYSSALAYLVDANMGSSSSAFAMNAFARGLFAFVMSEIAIPIRNAIGDGGLYTLIAGILAFACSLLVLLMYKGKMWRDPDYKMFSRKQKPSDVESGK